MVLAFVSRAFYGERVEVKRRKLCLPFPDSQMKGLDLLYVRFLLGAALLWPVRVDVDD